MGFFYKHYSRDASFLLKIKELPTKEYAASPNVETLTVVCAGHEAMKYGG